MSDQIYTQGHSHSIQDQLSGINVKCVDHIFHNAVGSLKHCLLVRRSPTDNRTISVLVLGSAIARIVIRYDIAVEISRHPPKKRLSSRVTIYRDAYNWLITSAFAWLYTMV